MHRQHLRWVLFLGLLAGCAGESAIKPTENLDERTGMTVGSLAEPLTLLPNGQGSVFATNQKRVTFAYLGPVEWDESGKISYGLWVDIAPGDGKSLADMHTPGAMSLGLDDATVTLVPMTAPNLGRDPYKPAVSWGQSAYFELSVDLLKHMAASDKLELHVRAQDDSWVNFVAGSGAHATLIQYIHDRGITAD